KFKSGHCIAEKPHIHTYKNIDTKYTTQKAKISDPATDAQIILHHRMHNELKEIANRIFKEAEKETVEDDWKFCALVVDRACLITFSSFFTAIVITFVFCAPHIIA